MWLWKVGGLSRKNILFSFMFMELKWSHHILTFFLPFFLHQIIALRLQRVTFLALHHYLGLTIELFQHVIPINSQQLGVVRGCGCITGGFRRRKEVLIALYESLAFYRGIIRLKKEVQITKWWSLVRHHLEQFLFWKPYLQKKRWATKSVKGLRDKPYYERL